MKLMRRRAETVLDGELADAKNFLTGVFPLRAETQEGMTNLIVNQHLFGLPEDYLQTYRENIDKVTAEDVRRVANKHVRPGEIAIVIVGDADEVIPQAAVYSELFEVFDIEGVMQDVSKYDAPKGEPVNVTGNWALTVDFQGQQLPVTLSLSQTGATVTGSLDTMLGKGTIAEGSVSGSKLSAKASAEMQGAKVEFTIVGKVDGDTMSGTITAPMVPQPLPFSGTRA